MIFQVKQVKYNKDFELVETDLGRKIVHQDENLVGICNLETHVCEINVQSAFLSIEEDRICIGGYHMEMDGRFDRVWFNLFPVLDVQ